MGIAEDTSGLKVKDFWGCGICGTNFTQDVNYCTVCDEKFAKRKLVGQMNPRERSEEVIKLLTGLFSTVRKQILLDRLSALIGKLVTWNDVLSCRSCEKCLEKFESLAFERA